jgi:competence protein ComGF
MIKKFVQAWKNLATIVAIMALKEAVLLFIFLTFLEVVKSKVLAVGYMSLEA